MSRKQSKFMRDLLEVIKDNDLEKVYVEGGRFWHIEKQQFIPGIFFCSPFIDVTPSFSMSLRDKWHLNKVYRHWVKEKAYRCQFREYGHRQGE